VVLRQSSEIRYMNIDYEYWSMSFTKKFNFENFNSYNYYNYYIIKTI